MADCDRSLIDAVIQVLVISVSFPRQSPATKERTLSPRGNLAAGSPGSRLPA